MTSSSNSSLHLFEKYIEDLVVQEVNAIGAGGVVGYTGPLGASVKKGKSTLWSNPPEKSMKLNKEGTSFDDVIPSGMKKINTQKPMFAKEVERITNMALYGETDDEILATLGTDVVDGQIITPRWVKWIAAQARKSLGESSLFKVPRDIEPAEDNINAPKEFPAFGGDPNIIQGMMGTDSHYNHPPAQLNPELVHSLAGDVDAWNGEPKRRGRTVSDKMRLNRKTMNGEIPDDLSKSTSERPINLTEVEHPDMRYFNAQSYEEQVEELTHEIRVPFSVAVALSKFEIPPETVHVLNDPSSTWIDALDAIMDISMKLQYPNPDKLALKALRVAHMTVHDAINYLLQRDGLKLPPISKEEWSILKRDYDNFLTNERPLREQSEQQFFYHATNDNNLSAIIDSGVMIPHSPSYGTDQDTWPDGSTQDRIYFGTSPKHVEPFYPEDGKPVLLKVPPTAGSFKKERGTGDWYTTKPIAIDSVQYLDPTSKSWKSLSNNGSDKNQLKFPFGENVLDQMHQIKTPGTRAPYGTPTYIQKEVVTTNGIKTQSKSSWEGIWNGTVPKQFRVWKTDKYGDMYFDPKTNNPVIQMLPPILYHGTTLAGAQKLLRTGVQSRPDGFDMSADPKYSKQFVTGHDGDVALVAVATKGLDLKKLEPSDNWEDTQNVRYNGKIPSTNLKIVAIATEPRVKEDSSDKKRELGILQKVKKNLDKKPYTLHDPPAMGLSITRPSLKDRPNKNSLDEQRLYGPKEQAPKVIFKTSSKKHVPVKVEVRDTSDGRNEGLMFRKGIREGHGMIFVFPFPTQQKFWMRNTFVPLDMIFITPERKVLGVSENTTPLSEDQFFVSGESMYVLEVSAGFAQKHGITSGTVVEFQGIPLVGKR